MLEKIKSLNLFAFKIQRSSSIVAIDWLVKEAKTSLVKTGLP